MSISGKYIYGIIKSQHDQHFGTIGLQGAEVFTMGLDELAIVVSHYESATHQTVRSSRKNLLAHQRVLESIMEQQTILPIKFGSLVENQAEIQNLLLNHYDKFKRNLDWLTDRIELCVKVWWNDMRSIYDEVLQENPEIQSLKVEIGDNGHPSSMIELGKMVERALEKKKQDEVMDLFQQLASISVDAKHNQLVGEQMVLNGAFLVSTGREKEFDLLLNELATQTGNRFKYKYIGPLAPYSFVNADIHLESWES
ncbi:MAG: GvpL/GvpF family gas vesicle protein [Flammeovirgaceae bacterium]